MSECLNKSITIEPQVGVHADQLAMFVAKVSRAVRSNQLQRHVEELRTEACSYLDRPSTGQLKLMFVSNVILDFACHGWSITQKAPSLTLIPSADQSAAVSVQKDRTRQRHLIERDAQLREPSVREFIKKMERRRLTSKGWKSIYSVIRDGEELSESLRKVVPLTGVQIRAEKLKEAVDPYLEIVRPDAVCSQTGLRLVDIWRYFRHTWVNTYRSVPGRNLMILIRDKAVANHPVIGIAALASSVIQQSIRDKWIAWDSTTAIESLLRSPSKAKVANLLGQLERFAKGIYVGDLIKDGLLTQRDLKTASPEVIKKLRLEAAKRIKMHQKNPERAAHKTQTARTAADWKNVAETNLYRSKRCKQLAAILQIRRALADAQLASCSGKKLKEVLQRGVVKDALSRVVRIGKAERVGINMMDIAVCGAIAPYNAVLGGKLVCLLLCSPEIVQAYRRKYSDHVSVIASGMRGREVSRRPSLVLLCTTSLYGNGSSQYNRIKLPIDASTHGNQAILKYEELGTSEGFGSFHFSKETLRIADTMLGRFKAGRKVNSIFGEGVNPLMRKIREALGLVGMPADLLLNHGNKRIIYGVALARNFREILLGFETRPRYFVPKNNAKARTAQIADYWINRWLSKRINNPSVLEQVQAHSLAYPICHGAQVKLPGETTLNLFETAGVSSQLFHSDELGIQGRLTNPTV